MEHHDASTHDELAALRREVAELRSLVADLAELAARPAAGDAGAGSPVGPALAAEPGPGPDDVGASADGGLVDRRAALRRGAGMAAAAVAGGAAIVAGSASPAAAATLTGSGNPGLVGNGVNGPGLDATTNAAGSAGVRASVSVPGAFGVWATHTGNGTAIRATNTASSSSPTVLAESSASTIPALKATNSGLAAEVVGGQSSGIAMQVVANGTGTSLLVRQQGNGVALNVEGPTPASTTGTGANINNVGIGAVVNGTSIGLRIRTTRTHLELEPAATSPLTRTVVHPQGAIVNDGTDLWLCTSAGGPGIWRKLGGTATAGAFHVLPVPVRLLDTRFGSLPNVNGPKEPLGAGQQRTVDCTLNASGVPAGATAVWLTILLVNAANANGNFTVWAEGATRPQANTMVWGGSSGRFTATALTALDSAGRCRISASAPTDIVIDVLGYFR